MNVKKERAFSIELNKRDSIKNMTLANGSNENVVIEGNIGELVEARFMEQVILQIRGSQGVLRIDLSKDEIKEKEK